MAAQVAVGALSVNRNPVGVRLAALSRWLA
jgi:hypothetical protein